MKKHITADTRTAQIVGITTIFDKEETNLLKVAAMTYSAMLDKTDALHPNPEMQANAEKLLDLAALLQSANQIRQFTEEAK